MIDGTFEKEFLAVSSRSMLARRWDAAGPRFCAARVPAVACGRRLWAGLSGIAAWSKGGLACLAGTGRMRGRSGLRARKGWTPARGVFLGAGFGKRCLLFAITISK